MTGGRRRIILLLTAALALALAIATPATAAAAPKTSAKLFNLPTPNAGLTDIVAGPDGALWFTEKDAGKIGRITTGGQISEYPINAVDEYGDLLVNPRELVASGGSLYALTDFGYILRINPADPAHQTVFWDSPGYDWPDQLAAGPGGGIWFASWLDEKVVRLASDGTVAGNYSGDGDVDGPFVAGPGGSVWFTSLSGSEYIREIDAAGKAGSIAVPRPGLEQISSLAFDRHGTPWFAKYAIGSWIVDPSGGTIGWVDGGGHAHQIDLDGDYVPDSLAAGPDGAIWFAVKHGIGRITTHGHDFSSWSLGAYTANEMTFGSDGSIWTIDTGANRIGRIGIAKAPRVSAPRHQRLRKVANDRRLRVRCKMRSAGRCSVEAQISSGRARKLGLKRGKRGEPLTLAHASKRFKRAGRHTLKLKLSRREARALGHTHRLTVHVTATARAAHAIPATARAKLRLRG